MSTINGHFPVGFHKLSESSKTTSASFLKGNSMPSSSSPSSSWLWSANCVRITQYSSCSAATSALVLATSDSAVLTHSSATFFNSSGFVPSQFTMSNSTTRFSNSCLWCTNSFFFASSRCFKSSEDNVSLSLTICASALRFKSFSDCIFWSDCTIASVFDRSHACSSAFPSGPHNSSGICDCARTLGSPPRSKSVRITSIWLLKAARHMGVLPYSPLTFGSQPWSRRNLTASTMPFTAASPNA
mmetsp:Transcript_67645/g.78543  ORF Transcript_67645/g.78543 Transcript_67645/m.78543 type:complete len:243 (-) Transcript_67645:550-1278(-)